MGLRNMEVDKKIKVEIPDEIPEDAQKSIRTFISEHGIDLPDTWEWRWLVKSGDYAGTFPRRLANFAYKEQKITIPPAVLENIGNFIRLESPPARTHLIEFNRDFDWKAGTFGDHGSCYMGSGGAGFRKSLRDNPRMYAVRFYHPDTDKGMARAWMNVRTDKTAVLFNAYGIELIEVARVVATALGLTYTKVKWKVNYNNRTQAYVNDKMFLVYPAGPMPTKKEIRGWVERK